MPDNTGDQSSAKFPRVTVITNGSFIKQKYPNYDMLYNSNENAPLVFNEGLRNVEFSDYVICLSKEDDFVSEHSLEELIIPLIEYNLNKGVYCDNIAGDIIQYYPYWSFDVVTSGKIVNTPLLFKPDPLIKFNEELKVLYHFQFLLQYGMRHLLHHVAIPLLSSEHTNGNITEEIKVVRECLTKL
jgi:hypothetical protein